VKPIKMLGLAMMAALMAMAFVGASSATATKPTALCSVDQLPCEEGNLVKHVHETTLEGKKAKLVTSFGTLECDVLFLGDVLTEGLLAEPPVDPETEPPNPLLISGNFTYSNCTLGGGKCTVKEEKGPTHIDVLKLAPEEADVTGEGLVHTECSGLNCIYNGKNLKGHGLGPLLSAEKNGSVSLEGQEANKESGLFCPSTSKLTITTTPLPNPVYISS
jgi:hypothetical protein